MYSFEPPMGNTIVHRADTLYYGISSVTFSCLTYVQNIFFIVVRLTLGLFILATLRFFRVQV